MQDAEAILKTSPSYLNQIARFATEAKAKGSKNKIPRKNTQSRKKIK